MKLKPRGDYFAARLILTVYLALPLARIFGVEARNLFGVNRNLLQCSRTFVGADSALENFAYNLFTVFLSHTKSLRIPRKTMQKISSPRALRGGNVNFYLSFLVGNVPVGLVCDLVGSLVGCLAVCAVG